MFRKPHYRVPVDNDHKPRMANKDAALGWALFGGTVASGIGAALIGGFLGKRHLRHQEEEGKVVKPPRFFSKDMFIGGAIGAEVAGLGALIGIGLGLAGPLAVAALVAIPVCGLIGSVIGGIRGRKRQETEYEEAKAYYEKYGHYDPKGKEGPPSLGHAAPEFNGPTAPSTISPESNNISQAAKQFDPSRLAQLQSFVGEGQALAKEQPPAETMTDKLEHTRPMGTQQR